MAGDTKLKPLEIQTGVDKNVTTYQAKGKWIDADKVRFKAGNPEKLGGWQKLEDGGAPFRGIAREAISWAALNGDQFYGLGTTTGIYIYNAGLFYDATPIRGTATETSAFNTFAGSSVVKVSDAAHGAIAGDYIVFPSVSADTLDIHGVYVVTSANTNNFTIQTSGGGVATNTKTKDVPAKTWSYLLATGQADNSPATGYGAGSYGSGTYGIGTAGSLVNNMRLWAFDTWGEDLMAVYRGGPVYRYDKSDGVGSRCSIADTNIPTRNNFILISEEARHMLLFGTSAFSGDFDPLLVRWSDSENYASWSPAVTNATGQLRLNSGSYIVGAVKSKKEIVTFTDDGAHGLIYQGAPFFFVQERLGVGCGLIGQNAAIDVNGVVFWMGKSSFYKYDGQVQKLYSTLEKIIFEPDSSYSINYDQKEKVFCGLNSEFNEIWWFYPSRDVTENNRYVAYNYLTEEWFDGILDRTTWIDSNLFDRPLATSTSAASYSHEIGHDANGQNLPAYIESGYFDIEDGQPLEFCDRIIPDINGLTGNYMKAYIKFKKHPMEAAQVKGPYVIGPNTKKISLRARGRQMALRVEVSGVGADFQLGRWRASIMPDGER